MSSSTPPHKGLHCWYLDKDGVYKCALKGCDAKMKENPNG